MFRVIDNFEFFESDEFLFPVTERILLTFFLQLGRILRISSVSPEKEKITKMSFFVKAPKSPWLASAALIYIEGVPVDDKVEEIFSSIFYS